MEFPKNNIIDTWLNENGSPEIEKLVEKNMAIANKIYEMLEIRGLKAADLSRMLNKKPSEISKWLTGTHTFTTKTITKIETVLGEDIIHIEAQKEFIYLKIYANQEEDLEETEFENSEVFATESGLEKKVS
jgi:transcriptional regulator with XRE-family HTH domain